MGSQTQLEPVISIPEQNCILCRKPLDGGTELEHAIPARVGGRARSRGLTCTRCNHNAGDTIDKALTDCYWPVMMALKALLPSASQPGGRLGKFVLNGLPAADGGGQGADLSLRACFSGPNFAPQAKVCVGDLPNSTSKAVFGFDHALIAKTGKRISGGRASGLLSVPTEMSCELPTRPDATCPRVMAAVLKAGILAMQEGGSAEHGVDFRSTDFAGAINLINTTIKTMMENHEKQPIHRFPRCDVGVFLGQQYEMVEALRRFRDEMATPPSDFEHYFIFSANGATETAELFAVLFSHEIFAFRLTMVWKGGDIVLGRICPVLGGLSYSRTLVINNPPLPPTRDRQIVLGTRLPSDKPLPDALSDRYQLGMGALLQKARMFALLRDKNGRLESIARLARDNVPLRTGCAKWLYQLFDEAAKKAGNIGELAELVEESLPVPISASDYACLDEADCAFCDGAKTLFGKLGNPFRSQILPPQAKRKGRKHHSPNSHSLVSDS